jgi:hypothetical protein
LGKTPAHYLVAIRQNNLNGHAVSQADRLAGRNETGWRSQSFGLRPSDQSAQNAVHKNIGISLKST